MPKPYPREFREDVIPHRRLWAVADVDAQLAVAPVLTTTSSSLPGSTARPLTSWGTSIVVPLLESASPASLTSWPEQPVRGHGGQGEHRRSHSPRPPRPLVGRRSPTSPHPPGRPGIRG